MDPILKRTAGQQFDNTSPLTFTTLLADVTARWGSRGGPACAKTVRTRTPPRGVRVRRCRAAEGDTAIDAGTPRCRSRARTRAGAGAGGSGRPRCCA
jgi:hypothetical protein